MGSRFAAGHIVYRGAHRTESEKLAGDPAAAFEGSPEGVFQPVANPLRTKPVMMGMPASSRPFLKTMGMAQKVEFDAANPGALPQ